MSSRKNILNPVRRSKSECDKSSINLESDGAVNMRTSTPKDRKSLHTSEIIINADTTATISNEDEIEYNNSSLDNGQGIQSNSNTPSQRPASLGFPDGLSMDPLSPSVLAISSELIDRLGNGLCILKEHGKKVQKYMWKSRKFDLLRKSWNSVVTVVLIEARDLPDGPNNGNNVVYCKFRLGTENHKSKLATKSNRPTWRERFNLYLYEDYNLEVTVWHKGKQKNFMGRYTLDVSKLDKEKTHDLWLQLECGFGEIHLLVTVSGTARPANTNQVAVSNGVNHYSITDNKYAWYSLDKDWDAVGELSVRVHGARGLSGSGLSGRLDAFCVLELDNSRVQTHTIHGTTEPQWDKTYKFEVTDITSALELSLYDEAILNSMKDDTIGKLTIPLLRINNGEKRWYGLKDKTKKRSAKGNCPRILLEMALTWNPVKASLRVLTPKQTKYVQKPPKFDIPLIYNNLLFVKDTFNVLFEINEFLKRLFEWESRERSAAALAAWLVFWLLFRPWMLPLLLLLPFLYHMSAQRSCNHTLVTMDALDEDTEEEELPTQKDEKTIKTRLFSLQDLTFTIKNGIDYIVSVSERINNLSNFTVPYLSYLAMMVLLAATVALFLIPFNYLIMGLGVYKFSRKFLKPDRVPNNDILDFVSRVPDNEIMKEWRELKVPEPNLQRNGSVRKSRH